MKKLPIGIQGFEKIRTDNFLYVDKTAYIYNLVHTNLPYFLSRPRRFGKSLLLSTMRAYWEGKRDLFKGLEIEKLEEKNPDSWKSYPVFYFDFNGGNYSKKGGLEESIDIQLKHMEKHFCVDKVDTSLNERFQNLLTYAYDKYGLRSVILVDEYDKPLLDSMGDKIIQEHNKDVFKSFFGTLKSFDEYIHFIFITGVSKFHKVSIFSDINQLTDISLTKEYAGICGITEGEVRTYFTNELSALAEEQNMTDDECFDYLRRTYDGYKFHQKGESVYNPYSILNAFFSKEFGAYWFETGTPSFLVKRVKEEGLELRKLADRSIYANEASLKDYTGDGIDLVPILYQTGYLTIADYDSKRGRYTLCFPNEEVTYGFLESLMPLYVPKATAGNGLDIFTLDDYIEHANLDGIRDVLTALFANITYTIENDPFEHYFQSVIYLVFTLLGKMVQCEMHTYTGRIDCKVETLNYIYLFEFKRDDDAESAINQINGKDYALAFVADSRKVFKIGVSFDSEKRKLIGWKVE